MVAVGKEGATKIGLSILSRARCVWVLPSSLSSATDLPLYAVSTCTCVYLFVCSSLAGRALHGSLLRHVQTTAHHGRNGRCHQGPRRIIGAMCQFAGRVPAGQSRHNTVHSVGRLIKPCYISSQHRIAGKYKTNWWSQSWTRHSGRGRAVEATSARHTSLHLVGEDHKQLASVVLGTLKLVSPVGNELGYRRPVRAGKAGSRRPQPREQLVGRCTRHTEMGRTITGCRLSVVVPYG